MRDQAVRPVGLRTGDDSGLAACAFRAPALSWRLQADRPDVRQLGYELQVAADPRFERGAVSSGWIASPSPVGAPWPAAPLMSRAVRWCRVRVETDRGVTDWSEPLRIEGTLFEPGDWIARPISPAFNLGRSEPGPVPLLRTCIELAGPVAAARLYATSLGVHELRINGARVGDALLEPGWTVYPERLLFAAHDVTALLRPGANRIEAAVGDGWWRGKLTWLNRRAVYGATTALLAQLEIAYQDGSREIVATDDTWQGGAGTMRAADIYDGCTIDLAGEAVECGPVACLPLPAGLEQRSMPPVRVVETRPVEPTPRNGALAVDCGQNLTGHLRLKVITERAAVIRVHHAEVLAADGGLHTAPLRGAAATDRYRLVPGEHELEPAFTYHGFRHAEIAAEPGVRVESVEARVVATDLARIGRFRCSDARLNRLYENIVWSQRGNFLALPTDCPQRDERLGWTGDIQVFAPTACATFDCRAFLASWLADLALEQAADGRVPSTVPNVIHGHDFEYGGVGWADAATLVPWALYVAYGDRGILASQFASMRRWVDWAETRLTRDGVWLGDFHLGDWLDPGAPPDKPEQATTDRDFVASAYLAHSARTVASAARVLEEPALADRYAGLGDRVAAASWRRWREPALQTQTGCALAIEFGISPETERDAVGAQLARLVEANDGRIATGFLGTPLVLPALSRTGQHDAAYRLLLNEQCPGWLYQVRSGATTMWERWDALLPDGSINPGAMAAEDAASMTSFNHYAYGSVGAWLYRALAGIAPAAPGYATIDFRPQPGGGIGWAEAGIDTPYGSAAIRWDVAGDELVVRLAVPPGATGRFEPPAGWRGSPVELGSGEHALRCPRA